MAKMLIDTDRVPSADLTTASNPAADDGLPPLAGFPEEEDTNAVVSPSHKDFLLTRIGSAFVAAPPGLPYVGLVGLALVITWFTYHEGDVSPLTWMTDICWSCGLLFSTVGPAVSLRRVTGTGAGRGQLAALGAGEVQISERARRRLEHAHIWISALALMCAMAGLLCLVTATRVGTRSKLSGRLVTAGYARALATFGLAAINFGGLTFGPWWVALKSASALVADAVAEARQTIERCSPTSPEWEAEVLPRVLRLCDETLPLLSRGFGAAVATNFLGWWFAAAGFFAVNLESGGRPFTIFWCIVCVLVPLGVSYDSASASSDCDMLSDALTKKRMRGDLNDQAFEHAISRIEKILDRQNTKQGLGFTIGHRVLDLKTLGNIVAAIAGVATTAVPILFSLRPSTVDIGTDVCSLSASQVATIQGVMMGTETCSYNVTLTEILSM
jgi:hypothetical protein